MRYIMHRVRPATSAFTVVLAAGLCVQTATAQGVAFEPQKIADGAQQAKPVSKPSTTMLSLPIVRAGNPLGEIAVSVDRTGEARFDAESVVQVLSPLLSDEGKQHLVEAVEGQDFVLSARLSEFGFELRFDMSALEVVLETVEPNLLKVRGLGHSDDSTQRSASTVDPADFSAYLSLAGNVEYTNESTSQGFQQPDILGFGAIRAGRFALQYEGGLTQRTSQSYGLYRRFIRGIYDIEDRNLRASAGDLQPATIPILGAQLLGGIGVERRKRIFSPFDPVFQLGGQRILINSPSTIEILRNGQTVRSIPVEEGVYDLQELPLAFGANDVEILVRDAAGRTSRTNFNYFYDPVELAAGDSEFGGYVGLVANFDSLEPVYSGDPAATAFYRQAFTPSLLIGGAIQASSAVQALAGEFRWVPQIIPGVLESQVAVSNGQSGVGFAGRVGYRWGRNTISGSQQASILVDYETDNFELVSRPSFLNEKRLTVTANYGQSIARQTFLTAGLNYFRRASEPERSTIFADLLHQFTPSLQGTVGAEYGKNDGFGSVFGIRLTLTLLLGRNDRAAATYESRRETYRAAYSSGLDNSVGSIGYDATIQSNAGLSLADASFRYRGNRFDGRFLVSSSGNGVSGAFDNQRAQFQLASSLAFADGAFGIGRTITDGFALVTAHPSIEKPVIVGNNLNDGESQGRSGFFGAAVVPNLIGYQSREVIYDIDSVDSAYDIGDGADRIRVPTGGGAKIVVGSARFVSAIGTLVSAGDPVGLAGGQVSSETDEGFESIAFFTNRSGRFSIIGLAPGEHYVVLLRDGRKFTLDVPTDSGGLFKVSTISIDKVDE